MFCPSDDSFNKYRIGYIIYKHIICIVPLCNRCHHKLSFNPLDQEWYCTNCDNTTLETAENTVYFPICSRCDSEVNYMEYSKGWFCRKCAMSTPLKVPSIIQYLIDGIQPLCSSCNKPLKYSIGYNRWWCDGCMEYRHTKPDNQINYSTKAMIKKIERDLKKGRLSLNGYLSRLKELGVITEQYVVPPYEPYNNSKTLIIESEEMPTEGIKDIPNIPLDIETKPDLFDQNTTMEGTGMTNPNMTTVNVFGLRLDKSVENMGNILNAIRKAEDVYQAIEKIENELAEKFGFVIQLSDAKGRIYNLLDELCNPADKIGSKASEIQVKFLKITEQYFRLREEHDKLLRKLTLYKNTVYLSIEGEEQKPSELLDTIEDIIDIMDKVRNESFQNGIKEAEDFQPIFEKIRSYENKAVYDIARFYLRGCSDYADKIKDDIRRKAVLIDQEERRRALLNKAGSVLNDISSILIRWREIDTFSEQRITELRNDAESIILKSSNITNLLNREIGARRDQLLQQLSQHSQEILQIREDNPTNSLISKLIYSCKENKFKQVVSFMNVLNKIIELLRRFSEIDQLLENYRGKQKEKLEYRKKLSSDMDKHPDDFKKTKETHFEIIRILDEAEMIEKQKESIEQVKSEIYKEYRNIVDLIPVDNINEELSRIVEALISTLLDRLSATREITNSMYRRMLDGFLKRQDLNDIKKDLDKNRTMLFNGVLNMRATIKSSEGELRDISKKDHIDHTTPILFNIEKLYGNFTSIADSIIQRSTIGQPVAEHSVDAKQPKHAKVRYVLKKAQ